MCKREAEVFVQVERRCAENPETGRQNLHDDGEQEQPREEDERPACITADRAQGGAIIGFRTAGVGNRGQEGGWKRSRERLGPRVAADRRRRPAPSDTVDDHLAVATERQQKLKSRC